MPRTRPLTMEQKISQQRIETSKRCRHIMTDNRISMTQVAELQGISAQAVSNQFKKNAVTIETLISVIYLSNEDVDMKLIKSW